MSKPVTELLPEQKNKTENKGWSLKKGMSENLVQEHINS